MKKILIIGQTPPPYGGQSINIGKIVDILGKHQFNYRFTRMDFSNEMSDNGKLAFIKIWRLIKIFFNIIGKLLFYRPDYVYYPVSGPEKVPVIRDMILLFPIRLFGKKVIYHFHAGGLAEMHPVLGGFLKKVYEYVYFNPEYAICMSNYGKRDPEFLRARQITIIPYGVDKPDAICEPKADDKFKVLFVGVCRKTKGIIDYVKIIELANKANCRIQGTVVGTIFGPEEKEAIDHGVNSGFINYLGVKTGADKNKVFANADTFLFPTFFEHENFPTVNLEAFSYSLPVISTKWRGVHDQVQFGENGYIHEVHALQEMADSIVKLSLDAELYQRVSGNAYRSYTDNYTAERFESSILTFFNNLI